jgi:hypothetical protein
LAGVRDVGVHEIILLVFERDQSAFVVVLRGRKGRKGRRVNKEMET